MQKQKLEIRLENLYNDVADLDSELENLVDPVYGEPDVHVPNLPVKDWNKLKNLCGKCHDLTIKLPKIPLNKCSKAVLEVYEDIKSTRSQIRKTKSLLKKINTNNVVVHKPKGVVVEKQETKLQNTTYGHYKFWNIKQLDTIVITEWGAIGTVGETMVKKFNTVYEATVYFQKKEQEKFKKGYVRV